MKKIAPKIINIISIAMNVPLMNEASVRIIGICQKNKTISKVISHVKGIA